MTKSEADISRAGLPRIEGFLLNRELGRGGFGVVYAARDTVSGARVAVKILRAEARDDPSLALRFAREAALLQALRHPSIVRTLGCGHTEDGSPYLVMEQLDGEGLDALLARRRSVPVSEALEILGPLAEALSAAHAHGVFHRDLKPSNVFLAQGRADGAVVLLDFGVAKWLSEAAPALTSSRAALGTLPYMSPEQARGAAIDARADVYGLAALAYHLLTGQPPFGAKPMAVLQKLHARARPPLPSALAPLDPALDAPLLRALSPDPDGRPASAPLFVADLRQATSAPGKQPVSTSDVPAARPMTLAVFVEVNTASPEEENAEIAVENAISSIRAALVAAGLVPLAERPTTLLALLPPHALDPPDTAACHIVFAAALRAHAAARAASPSDLISIGIAIHAGALDTHPEGAILPTGLADPRTWAPRGLTDVVVSRAALSLVGRTPEGSAALGRDGDWRSLHSSFADTP